MVTYEQYNSLSSLPRRYRKRVAETMFDDEEFIKAIDTKVGRVRSKHNPKLILTDSRIIQIDSGMVRSETEDYRLEEITSIQFNRGIRNSLLKLQGPAIDNEFPVTKRLGQPFATAAREQMGKNQAQQASE
ncbi:PH domain-containing protein [Saliphagus sp. GCM10025334]